MEKTPWDSSSTRTKTVIFPDQLQPNSGSSTLPSRRITRSELRSLYAPRRKPPISPARTLSHPKSSINTDNSSTNSQHVTLPRYISSPMVKNSPFDLRSTHGNSAVREEGLLRENLALEKLRELTLAPGNEFCADCGRRDPRYISTNLGVFLCSRCAGVHRSLGTHISRIRSLDNDRWTLDQAQAIAHIRNSEANAVYEALLDPNQEFEAELETKEKVKLKKTGLSTPLKEAKEFAYQKYVVGRWKRKSSPRPWRESASASPVLGNVTLRSVPDYTTATNATSLDEFRPNFLPPLDAPLPPLDSPLPSSPDEVSPAVPARAPVRTQGRNSLRRGELNPAAAGSLYEDVKVSSSEPAPRGPISDQGPPSASFSMTVVAPQTGDVIAIPSLDLAETKMSDSVREEETSLSTTTEKLPYEIDKIYKTPFRTIEEEIAFLKWRTELLESELGGSASADESTLRKKVKRHKSQRSPAQLLKRRVSMTLLSQRLRHKTSTANSPPPSPRTEEKKLTLTARMRLLALATLRRRRRQRKRAKEVVEQPKDESPQETKEGEATEHEAVKEEQDHKDEQKQQGEVEEDMASKSPRSDNEQKEGIIESLRKDWTKTLRKIRKRTERKKESKAEQRELQRAEEHSPNSSIIITSSVPESREKSNDANKTSRDATPRGPSSTAEKKGEESSLTHSQEAQAKENSNRPPTIAEVVVGWEEEEEDDAGLDAKRVGKSSSSEETSEIPVGSVVSTGGSQVVIQDGWEEGETVVIPSSTNSAEENRESDVLEQALFAPVHVNLDHPFVEIHF